MTTEINMDALRTAESRRSQNRECRSRCRARDALEKQYGRLISVNDQINRRLVSFQGNKADPVWRWFRYKEGFSRRLVEYLINELSVKPGKLLDPFAGVGTSLFAANDLGWKATGIELLPVGTFAMRARLAAFHVNGTHFKNAISAVRAGAWRSFVGCRPAFQHVRITRGAFPTTTENELNAYIAYCRQTIRDHDVRVLLLFAAYSILEAVSYTRKDGQYLRWDSRSGRGNGRGKFQKGSIQSFEETLVQQLNDMESDIKRIRVDSNHRQHDNSKRLRPRDAVRWFEDSSLTRLCQLESNQFDFILTSPPYCNRYDYTRTYALELVFLDCGEERIRQLRQDMLSCTVENKTKVDYLRELYRAQGKLGLYDVAIEAYKQQPALQEVLHILREFKIAKRLNNNAIARMVENYFIEMSLVIHECARLMKRQAHFVMVNDNVQYAGENIPVDLILSEFAKSAKLSVRRIWTLGKGKGNSSQQMGIHGRNELRKCIYIWCKP
jgi:hypothetical protein